MSARTCFAALLCLSLPMQGVAASCESHSAPVSTSLIELFTSEGCSSCPPADSWLRERVPRLVSPGDIVALAFHVDYWDSLGWQDRFADPAYTRRQHFYSRVSGSRFVFTPQVLLSGRNYSSWSNNRQFQQDVQAMRQAIPDANIKLHQKNASAGMIRFEVQADIKQGVKLQDMHVIVALYQNGLISDVRRGENTGSRLLHDYVVRGLYQSEKINQTGNIKIKQQLVLPNDAVPSEMGLAVFVQDNQTGFVVQAMSAPVCIK